jgi:hypothetical protein
MTLPSGSRVGPYEIIGVLGAGGMGVVYRARDTRLGREVALKTLPADLKADEARLKRFELEARATGSLNHPNIVALHDVGEHEGVPFVVTELLEGSTVREVLDAGPVPLRKALDWATQLAHGIAAAHEKGIVHRDLKPENLFITRDGHLKLLDFGLAKASENQGVEQTLDQTAEGAVLGTAGYMSPEQVRGRPADHRSDIFSLGAVLYELLAGRRAFAGSTAVERGSAILNSDPAELQVPPAVDRITRRCLEKSPDQRFQSARDLAFALEAISGTSSDSQATARPTPARGGVRIAVTVLVIAVAAIAGGWIRRGPSAEAPTFQRVTPRQGEITGARFTPTGKSVVFSGRFRNDPVRVFITTPWSVDARPVSEPWTTLSALSRTEEMALFIEPAGGSATVYEQAATLARAPLAGGAPRAVLEDFYVADFDPNGVLAVARGDRGGFRLEFPPGKTVFETPGTIEAVRVSRDGRWIGLLNHPFRGDGRGTVEVIAADGARRVLSSGWDLLYGLAWSPDGTELWFTGCRTMQADGGRVEVELNPSLNAVSLTGVERVILAAGMGWVQLQDVAEDGRVLLERQDSRSTMEALVPGMSRPVDLSWLDGTHVRGVSNDGKQVLFVEGFSGAVPDYWSWVRSIDGAPPVRLALGNPMAFSPDGRWVLLLPAEPFTRFAVVPNGVGPSRDLAPANFESAPLGGGGWWSADGSRVFFEAHSAGERHRLWVQDLDGGLPVPVSPEGMRLMSLPSPDDHVVAWSDGPVLLPLDGGAGRPLTGLNRTDRGVQWTTGGSLYVLEDRGPRDRLPIRIHKYDPATGVKSLWREIIPSSRGRDLGLFMTPDGETIVYSRNQIHSDLYVVTGLH